MHQISLLLATFHKATVSDDGAGATVKGLNQPVRFLLWKPYVCVESFEATCIVGFVMLLRISVKFDPQGHGCLL